MTHIGTVRYSRDEYECVSVGNLSYVYEVPLKILETFITLLLLLLLGRRKQKPCGLRFKTPSTPSESKIALYLESARMIHTYIKIFSGRACCPDNNSRNTNSWPVPDFQSMFE